MITGKNIIGYALSAEGNKTFRTFNPKKNSENDFLFTEATPSEINKAATLASEAFTQFRNISGEKKATFLNAIADEIAFGDL